MRCLSLDECELWRDEFCGRRTWPHQITCVTPLKRLPWFTDALLKQLQPFDSALLIVDQVVFDVPQKLEDLRRSTGEERSILEAPGHLFEKDSDAFLEAFEVALSDWIDLRVLFSPSENAVLADHDEYTTFFSESADKIAEVRRVMDEGGVKLPEWTADAP